MPTDPTPPLTAAPPFRTYTADGDGRPTLVAYTELYEWANRAAVQVATLTAEVEALRINLRVSNNEVAGFYNAALLADERCEKLTAALARRDAELKEAQRHVEWADNLAIENRVLAGKLADLEADARAVTVTDNSAVIATLTAALARRTEEVEASRKRIEELETPTLYWDAEDREYGALDTDGLLEMHEWGAGTVHEIAMAHDLPNEWLVVRLDPKDKDGFITETYTTEAEARAALAAPEDR